MNTSTRLTIFFIIQNICICRVRHQNPEKSNNFCKQNIFNEKLNITKNPFTWHLGDPCRAQLFDVSPISLNDNLYSRSEAFTRCNVTLSMPTNATLITVLNNVTLGCRDLFVTLSTTLHT